MNQDGPSDLPMIINARTSAFSMAIEDPSNVRVLVHEIYLSVQGESTFAGLPCVFVRLTGCPLRCSWCDTEHAFYGGKRMTLEEVMEVVDHFGVSLVEVTGGEPLAQPSCIDLLGELVRRNKTVLLETSGAYPIDDVPEEVHIIMDLKCPDSGEEGRNRLENLEWLSPLDEVKFVVASHRDFLWADYMTRTKLQQLDLGGILFSPVFGQCAPVDLVRWLLESRTPGVRMQIQMHKVIWPPDTRGV